MNQQMTNDEIKDLLVSSEYLGALVHPVVGKQIRSLRYIF